MRTDRGGAVYRITGARRSLDDDVRSRQRRYAISMGIRTVCFLLAVVTTGWLRWVMIAGAVALPYFAVVLANGGREPDAGLPAFLPQNDRREIGAGGDDRTQSG